MACVIKTPTGASPGVISFTTQEEKHLRAVPSRLARLKELKKRYVICLHYNWHNYDLKPDDLFDIHLAGAEDLRITNGTKIHQITMDACNFVREEYHPSKNEKMWDIFFAGNAVFFKDPIRFLEAIREIYDTGARPRVLYICPIPPYDWKSRKTVIYDLRERYERMFSAEEQDFFNLLIMRDRYPRFFDRQTLAHFYKSSKIFVHTAPDERRCRVATYAWASGNPVIGRKCVGSILPENLRKRPYFYEVDEEKNDFAQQIMAALEDYKNYEHSDFTPYRKEFSVAYTVDRFAEELASYFRLRNVPYAGKIIRKNLDHRMGLHHGFGISTNSVNQSLDDLLTVLLEAPEGSLDAFAEDEYFEEALIKAPDAKTNPNLNYLPLAYRAEQWVRRAGWDRVEWKIKAALRKLKV